MRAASRKRLQEKPLAALVPPHLPLRAEPKGAQLRAVVLQPAPYVDGRTVQIIELVEQHACNREERAASAAERLEQAPIGDCDGGQYGKRNPECYQQRTRQHD